MLCGCDGFVSKVEGRQSIRFDGSVVFPFVYGFVEYASSAHSTKLGRNSHYHCNIRSHSAMCALFYYVHYIQNCE